MEGWRQERLGSRAGTHKEEEKNKNILTGKEKRKNILDTHRPSHGRHGKDVYLPQYALIEIDLGRVREIAAADRE